MARKLLFTLFAAFLSAQSYFLLDVLERTPVEGYSALHQFFLGLLINLYVTGVFAFLGFVWPTHKLLPVGYYHIRHPEVVKRTGKAIGLSLFRAALMVAFWGKSKNRKRFFDGTRAGLTAFDLQTRQAEFGHLGALIAVEAVLVLLWMDGYETLFLTGTLVNVLGNFYPIVLQRTHRSQLMRMNAILERRASSSTQN